LFELDTTWGINSTSYTFSPNTSTSALTFAVSAFDSCFTVSTPSTYQTSAKSDLNTTVFVQYTYNVCGQLATLTWTPYIGWPDFLEYEIYGRMNGGPWTLFGTTTTPNFSIPVLGLQLYDFVIRSKSVSGNQSFSNKINVTAVAPSAPSFNYIRVATVLDEKITIRHDIELVGGIKELSLERKNEVGIFESIEKIPATNSFNTFTDEDVKTDRYSYTYRVRIIDSCGNEAGVSNEVSTILLRVQSDEINMKNFVSWSPYIGYNGSIIRYNLYRGFDGVFDWSPLAVLSINQLNFQDDLINYFELSGKICYYVEAVESMNIYSFSEISRSNETCSIYEPLIYIPNAFTPGGINPIFKPVVSLVNPLAYNLSILSRWGDVIFETNDMNEGWDGIITLSDQKAETGLYMYVLRVKNGDGEEITKRGHVSLLR
jgi:gliding motility-associated-like protein